MTDLNYITDGFYITLIPNNENGDYIWNEIAAKFDGVAKFPAHMKPSLFKQIKDAGYLWFIALPDDFKVWGENTQKENI